ncbi:MAG: hypothetical protein LBV78_24260 [Kitasatospora sp.]|jgi:hypothetical protein|nr:hypothetical protein [Kitasatospora sp.]
MTSQLIQDPYIAAVVEALASAGYEPADIFTDDSDTRGLHCYLRGVITLDPDSSGLDAAQWPHGLSLIWEWHTGIEAADGEPDRGPSWEWAHIVTSRGEIGIRTELALDGYASPAHIVDCVRFLTGAITHAAAAERWEHASALAAACETWGVAEAGQ